MVVGIHSNSDVTGGRINVRNTQVARIGEVNAIPIIRTLDMSFGGKPGTSSVDVRIPTQIRTVSRSRDSKVTKEASTACRERPEQLQLLGETCYNPAPEEARVFGAPQRMTKRIQNSASTSQEFSKGL